jgi:hypothetical protein
MIGRERVMNWKKLEAIVVYFKILSKVFPEGTEEYHEKPQLG